MGLAFRIFIVGYSQLIRYFLIQALASLIILTSFIYNSNIFLTVGLIIKLSMFPFHFWFINLIIRFSNFILWLSISLHKIPAVLIVYNFNILLDTNLFIFVLILSVLSSGVIIISTINLRYLLILSSIGNNVWFILSQYVSISFFLIFSIIYSILLFIQFYYLSFFSKEIVLNFSIKNLIALLVLSVSGLPPFPIFYIKLYIIFELIILNFNLTYFILLFFLSSFIIIGYIRYLFSYYTNYYNSSTIIVINKI